MTHFAVFCSTDSNILCLLYEVSHVWPTCNAFRDCVGSEETLESSFFQSFFDHLASHRVCDCVHGVRCSSGLKSVIYACLLFLCCVALYVWNIILLVLVSQLWCWLVPHSLLRIRCSLREIDLIRLWDANFPCFFFIF